MAENTPDPIAAKLEQTASLGAEIRAFLNTNPGIYLIQRCEEEMEEAMQLLKDHDPHDVPGIIALQNRIFRAEKIIEWLEEGVAAGDQADQALDAPEE